MRVRKTVLAVVLAIVICGVGYIAVDCVRLAASEPGTKPFITLTTYEESGLIEYKGLGYSVVYSYDSSQIYAMNIWLFDKILVWGWIT